MAASSPIVPAAVAPRARSRSRLLTLGGVAALLLVVLAAAGAWWMKRAPALSSSGPIRIAVLPFENLGAPEDAYFADGMTDEVRGKLAALPGMVVIARTSTDQYKGTTKPPKVVAADLGVACLWTRRYPQAIEAFEAALALAPDDTALVEDKATVFLAQGKLGDARRWLTQQPADRLAAVVATFGMYWDLMWVFDPAQRALFLSLPAEAFGGNRAARALAFAQTYALAGDAANLRAFSEEARKEFARQVAESPDDGQLHVMLGLSLAYLGRREEAIREGEKGVAALPISRDAHSGAYVQHQLARIYLILGENEKALDRLEPLLKIPYYLTPKWLAIGPNFAPLKGNPRFEKLLRQ